MSWNVYAYAIASVECSVHTEEKRARENNNLKKEEHMYVDISACIQLHIPTSIHLYINTLIYNVG